MLSRTWWSRFQALTGREFTLDAACNDDGSNKHCARFCSLSKPFSLEACEHVWCYPPRQIDLVEAWVQHFCTERAKQPESTGGVFLIPHGDGFPQIFQTRAEFQLLHELPAGTRMFTHKDKSGKRVTMTGIPHGMQAWYAAPEKHGRIAATSKGTGVMCFDVATPAGPATALADSGASTVPDGHVGPADDGYVSAAWAAAHGYQPSAANITHIVTASNAVAPLAGRIVVPIRIGSYTDQVSLLVMHQQLEGIDIILGVPWMRRCKVALDFHEGVARVQKGGKQHLLEPQGSNTPSAAAAAVLTSMRAHMKQPHEAGATPIKLLSARRCMRLHAECNTGPKHYSCGYA